MHIRCGLVAAALLVAPSFCEASDQEEALIRVDAGTGALVAVAIHPMSPDRVFVASERALYASADNGQRWQQRFRLPTQATARSLAVNAAERPTILLATDQGLYGSFDGGVRWSLVFRGAGEGERLCRYVAFHSDQRETALLGTQGGLFISRDGGRRWTSVGMPPGASTVSHFAFHPLDFDRLSLLTEQGLFIGSLSKGQWQKRHSVLDAEEAEVEEPSEETGTGEDTGSLHRLSAITADPTDPSTLYLATTRGLERSTDDGLTWQRLPRSGLKSMAVSRVLLQRRSPLRIYAATDEGVARYEPERETWTVITSGLATSRVNDLAAAPEQLWAATEQGLYRLPVGPMDFGGTEPPSAQDLLANFVHEPTIARVQEAAIRYAEVHPEKIKRWRRDAALQALLPSLDVGWDRDRSLDSSIDEGTFPKFQLVETEDRDAGFDASISWDLGKLIWNDDQTNIDVRSKLMVQLREGIVDEVTRTYFERRRLQMALLMEPPTDQRTSVEQELRLQELTALLDGLTGGYFSQQLHVGESP